MRNSFQGKSKKASGKKILLFLKVSFCLCIICAAICFKYSGTPVISEISQAVNRELKVDEAIAVIAGEEKDDSGTMEVFKENEPEESEQVFGTDFYIDGENEELQKAAEEEKKRKEEEMKKLSIENLSFTMSREELLDDTKPEPFRIPPPSSCSYDKKNISFKYQAPLYGTVTSRYGYRDHPIIDDSSFHTGLDIAAKKGSAVAAFADGTVIEAGKNNIYGNYVLLEHNDGIRSFYGHNSKLIVKKGQSVKLGQKIAEVGSTGMSTGPHLHFEVRSGNIRLDPSLYISPEAV